MEGSGMNETTSVIEKMAYRYNQLYLTPEKGISETVTYYDIVHNGKTPPEITQKIHDKNLGFTRSSKDKLICEITPAGKIEIIFFSEQSDFDRFIQIMAFKGEPAPISPKTESVEITGITNWRKIENHMNEYIISGGDYLSWREELKRFTDNKKNYQDSVIIIKDCDYCGITAKEAGFSEEEWNDISLKIRIYNACTRYTFRHMYKRKTNIIWDEAVADCIGMLFALNKYDTGLAKKIFGISKKGYSGKGKLETICTEIDDDINKTAGKTGLLIDRINMFVNALMFSGINDYYEILCRLEEKYSSYVSILN